LGRSDDPLPVRRELEVRGERVKANPDLCSSTTNPAIADSVAASDVHFALLLSTAKSARRSVATFFNDSKVTVTF